MSEQQIQNNELSKPVYLGENLVLNLGSTTLKELKEQKKVNTYGAKAKELRKKPDGLVVAPNGNIIVYAEYKTDKTYRSATDKQKAIDQELYVAKAVKAKIFLTKDSGIPTWINPLTGNKILNEHENLLTLPFDPANKPKETLEGINKILSSISETNDKLISIEELNPKELARAIHQKLFVTKSVSPSTALYTFVELFLFKYLSDLGILTGKYSFDYLYNQYNVLGDNLQVLQEYLGSTGARQQMKNLFPESNEDETSIINGNVFHEQIGDADIFRKCIEDFVKYDKGSLDIKKQNTGQGHGPFINISKDFKSQLFESFLKSDNDTKTMGQFFTPLKIVTEMVRMIDISDGMSICDPACGVGKFVLEAAVSKINDMYRIDGNRLISNITLKGYDKYSEDNGDKTIILAKANSVIYFSKFLSDIRSEQFTKNFANDFLSTSFELKKSNLGTLETIETEKYDIILANPPYIVNGSGDIKKMAMAVKSDSDGNPACYECNGLGLESLFMEWIVKALKQGGTANIVIPDGLLSNISNGKLRQYVIDNCYIKSIISLPINAFFNTPKKTYILTIQKKVKDNVTGELPTQTDNVFTYICNSIGETLDTYRFDIDDNDLKNGVNAYNLYRNSTAEVRLHIPLLQPCDLTKMDSNLHYKELPITDFSADKSWIIENWWSEEEKIALGLRKERKEKTIEDFKNLISETNSLLNTFKEELECLMK